MGNLKWVEQLDKNTAIHKQTRIKGSKICEMGAWLAE
jgi:hypothetical protein